MDNKEELRKGFILELKGPQGSGKTTFLNGLMEFLKTDKNINIRKVENEDPHSLMVSYESFDPIYAPYGGETLHNSDMLRAVNFGEAFEQVKKGGGMRLPSWQPDVLIKAQFPDKNSKMTAPYLYVESRFGKVPWKETMIELFSNDWEIL